MSCGTAPLISASDSFYHWKFLFENSGYSPLYVTVPLSHNNLLSVLCGGCHWLQCGDIADIRLAQKHIRGRACKFGYVEFQSKVSSKFYNALIQVTRAYITGCCQTGPQVGQIRVVWPCHLCVPL